MIKKKVGVVCGGFSSEFEISIQSGNTVFKELDRDLWDVFLITIRKELWTALDDEGVAYNVNKGDFSLQRAEQNVRLDLIFNTVHGPPGENGQLAALWELLNIPFSSCDSYNAALTFNKRDCLAVLKKWKVPCAKNITLDQGDPTDLQKIEDAVGFPCFVKANRAGSSFGVYKVHNQMDLETAIQNAFKEDNQLLIESALIGREVSVGVAAINTSIQILPITEIISENDFFDYAAKYEGKAQEITPAKIPKEWEEEVQKWSKFIYKKLGLKGVVRSEFIFVEGIPHFLEINTVPGMTSKSIIPQQVDTMGMKLSDFFNSLLQNALEH